MRIGFEVHGELPPKKDGAQSIWGKPTEARRIEKLQRAAHQALAGGSHSQGQYPPYAYGPRGAHE